MHIKNTFRTLEKIEYEDYYDIQNPGRLKNYPYSYKRNIRRVSEIVLSIMSLILLSPLLILLSIFMKFNSKGPVFFIQNRVGINKEVFKMIKFRTMSINHESEGNNGNGNGNGNISNVGKFLRKHRIDEIPQLLNVIKGDMSFIGPRPEIPEVSKNYSNRIKNYSQRYLIKPGITGLAQVNQTYYSSLTEIDEKLKYDLEYIQNHSFILDLKIGLLTFKVMLKGSGG